MRKAFCLTALSSALLLITGCTLAPTYKKPEAPVAQTFPKGAAYEDVALTTAPMPEWTAFFTNPKAREVIRLALENNRDLRIAVLNVEKTRAAYGIQRAALVPSVNATGNENVSKSADALSPTGTGSVTHAYQANLASAAWELDLFGRVRSLSEAALQSYFASEENRLGAQNTLIAAVANAWINLGAQKEFLKLQKVTLKSQEQTLKLMNDSYRLGASSLLALEQAKTTVAAARSQVAAYERSVAQARNALTLLAGAPVPVELEPERLEEATSYGAIAPAGLSSEVLLNRPDIRAAENNLKSANANIGAARANFFPRISLTASIGTTSRHLSDLFGAGSGIWSFTPAVSLPIFAGGANISALKQAEAQKDIMVATYEKAIQTAFSEVSDALAALGTVNKQSQALKDLVSATQKAYSLSQDRYRSGLDGFLTVLESQRQMVSAQTNFISAETNRLTSNITLYKVLGGGAVNAPDAASSDAADPAKARPRTVPPAQAQNQGGARESTL